MSTVEKNTTYQPGVCNIGPAEIRKRRAGGYLGLAISVVAIVAFVVFHVPTPWRLLIAIPAFVAANGFLQAALHFCVGFGSRGLFNMGNELGHEESVVESEFRKADQKKALQINVYSLLITIVVVVIAVLVP